ncbi:MAG TPA: hypothetical protein VH333_00335 [Pseudonocardiaceae bacterium]|jgi:hypothetical protein|nr:hypothetical protein [Pseudonocardiaceae bacterium]
MIAAHMFLRRMLWRHGAMLDRVEPVVALLGPPGSGKTTALTALSEECGGTVVHASLDFGANLDPVAAVAFVALTMMDTWSNLPRVPTFHRVGLTLLALNENLPDDRAAARARLRDLARLYVRECRPDRAPVRPPQAAAALATALTGIDRVPQDSVDVAVRLQAKPAIATLLRAAGRLPGAIARHGGLLELDDPNMISALIAVSRTRRKDALSYLARALLADIQDNAVRHAAPAAHCQCLLPRDLGSRPRHQHAWVLLVDDVAGESARRFLTALIRARQDRAAVPVGERPAHDPLLVVAAVDEWALAWGQWWCEPWQVGAAAPDKQRVPLFSQAGRQQWLRHADTIAETPVGHAPNTAQGWYPVWLDPLDAAGVETLAPPAPQGVDAAVFGDFVRRLSGSWPAAVIAIRDQLAVRAPDLDGRDPVPRSLLRATGERDDLPLWERAVSGCLPGVLPVRRPWQVAPAVVAVAAHLAEPERSTDDLDPTRFPEAARTLRRLRTKLWISTFHARPSRLWAVAHGDAEHPAEVQPWLARCLFAGLTVESDAAGPVDDAKSLLWEKLFTDLATPADAGRERMSVDRTLFHDLACDKLDIVVRMLSARFDSDDHRSWIGLLDHVTSAPCPWPGRETTERTFQRLSPDDDPDRSSVEAAVTNLVVLLWLYRDPLTVPEARWDRYVHDNLQRLITVSRQADITALYEAAAQFVS